MAFPLAHHLGQAFFLYPLAYRLGLGLHECSIAVTNIHPNQMNEAESCKSSRSRVPYRGLSNGLHAEMPTATDRRVKRRRERRPGEKPTTPTVPTNLSTRVREHRGDLQLNLQVQPNRLGNLNGQGGWCGCCCCCFHWYIRPKRFSPLV